MVYPAKLTASHLDAVRAQAPARQFFAPQGRVYVFEDEGLKRINIVGRYVYPYAPTISYRRGTLMAVF